MVMLMQCFACWLMLVLPSAAGSDGSVSDCGMPAEGSALLQTQQPIRKVDALVGHPVADMHAPAQLPASSPPLVDQFGVSRGVAVAQLQAQAVSLQATSALPSHDAASAGQQSPHLLAPRLETSGSLPAAANASVSNAAFHVAQAEFQPRSVTPSALSASVNHTAPQLPGVAAMKLTGELKENFDGRQESEFTQTQATVHTEAQVSSDKPRVSLLHGKKVKTWLGSFQLVDLVCMAFAAIVMFLFLVLADIL